MHLRHVCRELNGWVDLFLVLAAQDFECVPEEGEPDVRGTYFFAAIDYRTGAIATSNSSLHAQGLCESQGGTVPYTHQPLCTGFQRYLIAIGLLSQSTPWTFFYSEPSPSVSQQQNIVICQRKFTGAYWLIFVFSRYRGRTCVYW